jgi:hypothetical protein
MAVASITEELEGKERTDGMGRWNHLGAWKACLIEDLIETDLTDVGQKEKESAKLCLKVSRGEIQMTYICYGSSLRPYARRPLVIASPGQASKPFFFEDHGYCSRTQFMALIAQEPADIIDGEVLLAQSNDLVPKPVCLGSTLRTFGRRNKEASFWILAKLVTENAEASLCVSKPSSRLSRRETFDEIGSQGLVLPMSGIGGFEKDPGEVCWFFEFTFRHSSTMST